MRQGMLIARLRRYFALVLVLAILCAGALIGLVTLFWWAAELWIVCYQFTSSDAFVVLGGGIDLGRSSRPTCTQKVCKKGAA
jgi:hypothetical protein